MKRPSHLQLTLDEKLEYFDDLYVRLIRPCLGIAAWLVVIIGAVYVSLWALGP